MKMNYHIEHHVIPMVPYHTLPKLHKAIHDQTPFLNYVLVMKVSEPANSKRLD